MRNPGRMAGAYCLIVVVLSFLYMEYIPSVLVDWETPSNTNLNLLDHEFLLRVGIAFGVLVHIAFVLLPMSLHELLGKVNRKLSLYMVVFALISVPISFPALIDQLNLLDKTVAVSTESEIIAFKNQDVQSIFRTMHNGLYLNQVFWGLWLFPLGLLVYKTGFIPKLIRVLLMLGTVPYLIDVFGGILIPEFHHEVNTRILILPAAFEEIGLCLWSLIAGVSKNKLDET